MHATVLHQYLNGIPTSNLHLTFLTFPPHIVLTNFILLRIQHLFFFFFFEESIFKNVLVFVVL